jgi:CubicO group peptidase (beta-lactamase class C family)
MIRSLLSLITVAVGIAPILAAQPAFERAVDAILARQVTADSPGAAIAVVDKGKVVLLKGYGLADIERRVPITPQTTFELASVTKQFTAMAIMKLHDRGKLTFDDDVRKYMPELPVYDAANPVLIRNLLQHTSGLPEYFSFGEIRGKHPGFVGNDDFLPLFGAQKDSHPLQFPTGQRHQYTNTNYLLLASIVERISGRSYGAFMRDEIFRPLGMMNTVVFENPQVRRHQPATGYRRGPNGYEIDINEQLLTVGDGAIWSSAEDMARWDAGLRKGALVKPQTMAQALVPSKTKDGLTNDYGFGWSLILLDGRPQVMRHSGDWVGFHSYIERRLLSERTVIVLDNSSSLIAPEIGDEIIRSLR